MGRHVGKGRKFGAMVKGDLALKEKQLDAIVQQSTLLLARDMLTIEQEGGRLPFRTGALRASFMMTVFGKVAARGGTHYRMVLNQFRAGERLRGVFTKSYAPHLEYGTRNPRTGEQMIRPRHFVLGAVRNWRKYVDRTVRRIVTGRRGVGISRIGQVRG